MSGRLVSWVLVAVGVLALFIGLSLLGPCKRQDKPGQRADSVLATDTTWKATVRQQDSTIAKLEDSIRVTDAARRRWRDSARALTRAADLGQEAIDSAVAAGVPPGVEPTAYYKSLFQSQVRVAATLRLQVIPALEATIVADSVGIEQRDEYGSEMRRQRDFARERVKEITREFTTYRQATKDGIDLGLFRVPDEVVKVAAAGAIFYAGCKAGGGC